MTLKLGICFEDLTRVQKSRDKPHQESGEESIELQLFGIILTPNTLCLENKNERIGLGFEIDCL